MIHTLRLTLPNPPLMDTFSETDMHKVADMYLATVGLTLADVTVNVPSCEDYSTHTHFGNWSITPVLDVPAIHTLNVDYPQTIIEASDIAKLRVGQKVDLQYAGCFGMETGQGTIHKITTARVWFDGNWQDVPCVEILKKGTKSGKGWRIVAGDCANIWPVEKEN